MPVVLVEGLGKVQFDDAMSPEEIRTAIERDILPRGSASREAGREAMRGGDWKNNSFGNDLARNAKGAIASAVNGVTFGFGDEAIGALSGLINKLSGGKYDEGYQQGRDYVRGINDEFSKANPVASAGANIGGSLLTAPLAVLNAAGKSTALGRAGVAAGTGALTGALQGAGDAESVADIPEKAGMGALIGGVLGAATDGVGVVLKNARDQVMARFSGPAAAELALRRVGLAIVRDEKTGQQVVSRMNKLGPEATIADSAGKNTLDLLDTVATLPGKTGERVEQAIRQRQVTRAARMDAIPDALGGGQRADVALDSLQKAKEIAAGPLYARVEQLDVPVTGTLAELSQRPVMKAAMEQARVNAQNKGAEFVHAIDDTAMNSGTMPLMFWDDVKRGLDDVIGKIKRNPGDSSKATSTLRDAVAVKNQLVQELDNLSVDPKTGQSIYKQARDAFAGPAALQDAIETGRQAMSMSAAEINRAMFGMSKSEQDAFRIGAAEALRDKVGSRSGQTNLLNAYADRNTRQQLQALFGDERGFREAMSTILGEGQLKRLERVGRGSQTAGREARMEDMNVGVLEDAAHMATGAKTGNVMGVFQAARSLGGRLGTPESVRDEIGRILLERGVPAQQRLAKMEQIIRSMQMGNSQAAAIEGVLGGSLMNP